MELCTIFLKIRGLAYPLHLLQLRHMKLIWCLLIFTYRLFFKKDKLSKIDISARPSHTQKYDKLWVEVQRILGCINAQIIQSQSNARSWHYVLSCLSGLVIVCLGLMKQFKDDFRKDIFWKSNITLWLRVPITTLKDLNNALCLEAALHEWALNALYLWKHFYEGLMRHCEIVLFFTTAVFDLKLPIKKWVFGDCRLSVSVACR